MLKALSMLCFTFLALASQAAENRIAISPLLASFGSKIKSSLAQGKVVPKNQGNLPSSCKELYSNRELTDKDVLLLAKYSLLHKNSSNAVLSFDFVCSTSHRLRASGMCKTTLSKRVNSHVSRIAAALLNLHNQHSLFDSESIATLKRLASLAGAEGIESSLSRLQCLDKFVSRIPILVPQQSARITSHFGSRQVFKRRISQHTGTDMTSSKMTVHAAADGVVASCSWIRGYGNILTVDHGGIKTRYAHLSKFYVKPGSLVRQGQEIALEGATGRSRGRHLHFEVLLRGEHVDPMSFISCSMSSDQMLLSQAVLARQVAACKATNLISQKFAVAKTSLKGKSVGFSVTQRKIAPSRKVASSASKGLVLSSAATKQFSVSKINLGSNGSSSAPLSARRSIKGSSLPATRVLSGRNFNSARSLPSSGSLVTSQLSNRLGNRSIPKHVVFARNRARPRVFARSNPVFNNSATKGLAGHASVPKVYIRARY